MDIINKVNKPINQVQIYKGFLVDKIWVDRWKKYSNYDFIKDNYLLKNFNDENIIKKSIINYLNNNNLNYDDIKDIGNYIIKDINQLKLEESLNKSYVLMNLNYLKTFPFKEIIALTTFYLSYQNIQIRHQNVPIISFKTNNNVIINQINFNNEYSSEYLKHLIRFAYFKKELHRSSNLFQNDFSQAYIIKTGIIDKLKKIYNLKDVIMNLDNNKILNGITYQNFDDNYSKISKFLNSNQINYINSIKIIETQDSIKFTEKENGLKIKYLCNQTKLKYMDGFEIIDIKFGTFLKKIIKNIIMHPVNFVAINNKYLTIINEEKQNYYEIFSLDQNNILTFECLMLIVVNKIFKDKNYLNNYIFNYLIKNELDILKSKGNPISLENNTFKFCLYFKDIYYYNPNMNKNNINNNNKSLYFQDEESSKNSYNLTRYNIKYSVNFNFITSLQQKVSINIDADKTVDELIKLFFKRIKHPELFGDPKIIFLFDGKLLSYHPNELIKDYFTKNEYYFIAADLHKESRI